MGSTLEMVVVGGVVAVALIWAVRAVWKSLKTRGGCPPCGSSGECPLAGVQQLEEKSEKTS